jgi:hypothetical protein
MANPTTNYGFVLPTPTDLVTDLPADFDVALQGVDTRLKALQPGTTLGDLAYSSATANTNTRLGIGTTGQVLSVVGGVPAWAASPAGGKVLQVVMGQYTTPTVTVSSSTYTDTGATATITPSAATSKVLVLTAQPFYAYKSGSEMGYGLKLLRGATVIANQGGAADTQAGYINDGSGSRADLQGYTAFHYLDSPATTSATTYKLQGATWGSGAVAFANGNAPATIILMEIGA